MHADEEQRKYKETSITYNQMKQKNKELKYNNKEMQEMDHELGCQIF